MALIPRSIACLLLLGVLVASMPYAGDLLPAWVLLVVFGTCALLAIVSPTIRRSRFIRLMKRCATVTASAVAIAWLVSISAQVRIPYSATQAWGLGSGKIIHYVEGRAGEIPLKFSFQWSWSGFTAGHFGSSQAGWANGETTSSKYWALWPLATGLLLAAVVLWMFGTRRFPPGTCRTCGYDLRASFGRCPECGTTPAK